MPRISPASTHIRDILIVGLVLATVATNYYWYQMYQGVDLSLRNGAQAWNYSQTQIAKLKNCIDTGTKPCDISSPTPVNSAN